MRERLWFFTGYQYLRDYDSQPGADPAFPRTYEQDKIFGKLTWRLKPGLQLMQSFHEEFWVNPRPADVRDAVRGDHRARTRRCRAMTFGDLTHTLSPNTVWDRARRPLRLSTRTTTPAPATRTTPSRFDRVTGVSSGNVAAVRRADAHPHDSQGDAQPLPARIVRRRSRVEDRHAGRAGRALRGRPSFLVASDIVDNNGQPFQAISARSFNRRRSVRHRRRVRERHGDDRRPASRSTPASGSITAAPSARTFPRSTRKGTKPSDDHPGPGHALHLERRLATSGRHRRS